MDNEEQLQLIESRLHALEGMRVGDEQSARAAFAYAMLTVIRVNRLSSRVNAQAMMGAGAALDDEVLGTWVDRLVVALTRIVEKLAGAASFSVSAGGSVLVSVEFVPSGGGAG